MTDEVMNKRREERFEEFRSDLPPWFEYNEALVKEIYVLAYRTGYLDGQTELKTKRMESNESVQN